jgi:prepilin-type N-terminal cleavage/methylation domain-containing protein
VVKPKGMTLIEVMIALVITTVGLLGALAMVGSLYTASAFNRNATEAMTLAETTVEQANSKTVSLSDSNSDVTETGLDAYGSSGTAPTNMFSRRTRWNASADGSRRVCTVDVSWTDGTGTGHSVTMSTERIP